MSMNNYRIPKLQTGRVKNQFNESTKIIDKCIKVQNFLRN